MTLSLKTLRALEIATSHLSNNEGILDVNVMKLFSSALCVDKEPIVNVCNHLER